MGALKTSVSCEMCQDTGEVVRMNAMRGFPGAWVAEHEPCKCDGGVTTPWPSNPYVSATEKDKKVQPAPAEITPIAWSYSALTSYETCPKKHWHTRIAKDVSEGEESEPQRHGKRVHKALENRILHNIPLSLDLAYAEGICQMLVDAPGKLVGEQKLAVDFDMKPCDWFDKRCYIRAIVDAGVISDKSAILIDWKTGKISTDVTQLRLAAMLMLFHLPKLEKVQGAFVWLRDKEITKVSMERKDIPEFWNLIKPRADNLARAKAITDYPARPGGLCKKWCPVRDCPHHGV